METPIEIARRVWPGEWVAESGFLRLDLCAPAQLPLCMWVRLYADDFVVELSTPGVWRLQASRPDLAEALTIAHAKVTEFIIELAHGVGLATFTPTTDKDAAIVAEITAERRLRAESWLTMEDGEAIEIVQDFARTASGHLTGKPASAPATSLADAVQALHIEEGLPHDDSLRLRPDPRAVAAIVVCRDFEPGDEPVMMLAHPTDPGKVRAVFVRDLKRVEVPRG